LAVARAFPLVVERRQRVFLVDYQPAILLDIGGERGDEAKDKAGIHNVADRAETGLGHRLADDVFRPRSLSVGHA
jgi:hypothetical protein